MMFISDNEKTRYLLGSFPKCPCSFYISVLTAFNRIKRFQKRRCSRHTCYTLVVKIENALAADVFQQINLSTLLLRLLQLLEC